ncbi:trehalase family glycosidase [Zobellia nedashkovskayae]
MATQEQADSIAEYIKNNFLKPGGVVTTLKNTGEQWDAPNGWAPLQWMTIVGLENYGHDKLANTIAQRWVKLNEKVYANTGKFVEKYNVEDMSLDAGGGEYPVQDGFGWSNGVYLALKAKINKK